MEELAVSGSELLGFVDFNDPGRVLVSNKDVHCFQQSLRRTEVGGKFVAGHFRQLHIDDDDGRPPGDLGHLGRVFQERHSGSGANLQCDGLKSGL